MKKVILTLLLSVLIIANLFAVSVIIGNGTTTSAYTPAIGYYNYGWSHFILPGEAITSAINITKLEFDVSNTPANYIMNSQVVYMKLTSATTVTAAYTDDPIAAGYTQIYNSQVTWNGAGWQGINLTNPFAYDGISNLEIIWENRDGSYATGYPIFYQTNTSSACAYRYKDNNFPDENGNIGNTYPNTRVSWLAPGEPGLPVLASPANNATYLPTDTSLSWTIGSNTTYAKLYLATNADFTNAVIINPATSPYLPILGIDVRYYWKVVAVSQSGLNTESETWSFTTFAIPFPNADVSFDGAKVTNQSIPMEPYFNYSISQSIYNRAEFNMGAAAITSISYLYNKNSNWSETIEIYMKHTTKDTFSGSNDWEMNNLIHVYSGLISVNRTEEVVTINLDNLFIYNGRDNLLVLFYATQPGCVTNNDEFYSYSVEGNRSLEKHVDSVNYYATFPSVNTEGTLKEYLPITGFNYQALSGEPEFTVSADTLTFLDHDMGGMNDSKILTISNNTASPLTINSAFIGGLDDNQFRISNTNTYPVTLISGGNMSVSVIYGPTAVGEHAARLEIVDNLGRVHYVQLVGNAIDNNIYAEDLPWKEDFEEALSGWYMLRDSNSQDAGISITSEPYFVQSGTKAIKFYNAGDVNADLRLIAPNLVPDMGGYRLRFWMWGAEGSQLILGKYVFGFAQFVPIQTLTVPGYFQQMIVEFPRVRANERLAFKPIFSGSQQLVLLDNITFETIPTTAVAELNTNLLDFEEIKVTQTSELQSVTISNVGIGELTINQIAITGVNAGDFAFSVNAEASWNLYANESLTISVTFTPTGVGVREATLVITDNLGRTSEVLLRGSAYIPGQGSTCANPIPLTFPTGDITDDTGNYGNDYHANWVSPTNSYLIGDDVVYQFSLNSPMLLNGTVTTTDGWIGVFILQDEPNEEAPVSVILAKTSSGTSVSFDNNILAAGTYYLIISSLPSPQSIAYTLNLTTQPLQVTGAATNPSPINNATNVALMGALTWQSDVFASGFYLYLSSNSSFNSVSPINQPGTSYAFTGLDYDTTYYWKVIPYNAYGQSTGNVAVWSFTTMSDPVVSMPVVVNFEGSTSIPGVISSSNMEISSTHGNYSNGLYGYVSASFANKYAQFQVMGNVEAGTELNFEYRIMKESSYPGDAHTISGYDRIRIKVSDDLGVNFTTLTEINNTNHVVSTSFANVSVPLGNYAGQQIIVRLEASWGNGDYYVDFDNFYFRVPPTIPVATLSADNLDFGIVNINQSTSKQLSVTNTGSGNLTITNVSIEGLNSDVFNFSSGTPLPVILTRGGQPLVITVGFNPLLDGNKEAALVITDNLARSTKSVILSGYCNSPVIHSLPFTEGFERSNVHNSTTVNSWTQITVSGTSVWTINKTYTNYNRTPRTGDYNLTLQYNNKRLLIRAVQLVGGQAYDVQLYARQDIDRGATVGIYYGTVANVASMVSVTGQVDVVSGNYQLIRGTFTPVTDGIYYLGIRGELTGGPMYLSIDDITIKLAGPDQPDVPVNVTITTTANGSMLHWDPVYNANSYNIYGCNSPDGEFLMIISVGTTYFNAAANTKMKFFKVKANSEPAMPTKKTFTHIYTN